MSDVGVPSEVVHAPSSGGIRFECTHGQNRIRGRTALYVRPDLTNRGTVLSLNETACSPS